MDQRLKWGVREPQLALVCDQAYTGNWGVVGQSFRR